jgi:uncharacterized protein YyaL (SSP411 family)
VLRAARSSIVFASILALSIALAAPTAQDPAPKTRSPHKALPTADELKALPPDGGPDYNRLVFEKSPYLLQHATNPVDWFPWGDEAFAKARSEAKPIFLSIGYSTCHWCHVMEHDSFEDAEVAALLNKEFIAIKVDREERPDVDQVYMQVTQAITGSGGWPMTVVMTADKQPFFAGTFFPKHGVHGGPGLLEILKYLAEQWKTQRETVVAEARKVVDAVRASSAVETGGEADASLLQKTRDELANLFDAQEGGFGTQPKFPMPHQLRFLLRYARRTADTHALEMVERTLQAMARGGIRDHVGFGFHRYSTDRAWLVPHFEKMLYDQALIAMAYVEAYEATKKPEYRDVAREIFEYVLRDMTSPEGCFYSAEDADSEGKEGLFYTWTAPEIVAVLGRDDAQLFGEAYGVPMSESDATGTSPPRHVLHLASTWTELAAKHGVSEAEVRVRIESSRKKLFAARDARVHPSKDDKILSGWNGLMIAALAHGARAFEEPRYAEAARRAADFVIEHMYDRKTDSWARAWRHGSSMSATADDYAYFMWGMVELYETDFNARWLGHALQLDRSLTAGFWDDEKGGYFLAPKQGEQLFTRNKDCEDTALPSSNSVAALALIELSRITGKSEYESRANRILQLFAKTIAKEPAMHAQMMIALELASAPSLEIVIVSRRGASGPEKMLSALRSQFLPNAAIVARSERHEESVARDMSIGHDATDDYAPFTRDMKTIDGKVTAYVCRNFACELPTTDVETMMRSVLAAPKPALNPSEKR